MRWKETTSLRACAELPPTCLRRWARGRLRRMRGASAGRGGSVPQGAELARLRGGRRPPVCPACILQTRAKRCLFSASVPLKFANCLAWGEGGGEGRVSGLFGWAGLGFLCRKSVSEMEPESPMLCFAMNSSTCSCTVRGSVTPQLQHAMYF